MPLKYVVHTKPVPNRFERITKSGIIAWEEGCLKCAVCVKKRCVYNVYDKRALDPYQMIDSIDNQCMNCFRCVQSCPKELIHKSLNPEFTALGDSYWSPDIIAKIWYQAETGSIPVSGAGYPGPFSGPGFDSMWTDMSEIVRPTRDGIHGREYISTSIDLGSTVPNLIFSDDASLEGKIPKLVDIPLPMILRIPFMGSISSTTIKGWAIAAERLQTLLAVPEDLIEEDLKEDYGDCLIPVLSSSEGDREHKARISEIPGETAKSESGGGLKIIRLPIKKGVEKEAVSLAESGAGIIHLEGSPSGKALDDESVFIKDAIRSVHMELVEKGIRDEVSILASGGFAMAEHVAKAIICGADAVFIDLAALIALECRMCGRCTKGLACPVKIEEAPARWVAARLVNLIGAWHNQLLEVMGAMGIRDARRLRGEAGRAMFFEEMDQSIFGSMGKLEDNCELE